MANQSGRFAIVEQLLADGITYMFGNPGTVEQGFLDALSCYPNFKYILALHEGVAVGMADGYARSTKKPTVVQLHSSVGLGNGIGMIYQAYRGHAPLIILSGEAGIRYDALDAQMAVDLVAMAKPVTKWATRVVDPSSVLRVLRRAIKIAATPPMGPVFVCLPMDILDAINDEKPLPTSFLVTRVAPEPDQIALAASFLATAQKPLILLGDGVAVAGAQPEVTRVAELTGSEVWGADSSEVNISATHPLFQGQLGHMFGEDSRKVTSQADVVLICGTYVFPEVFPVLSGAFAEDAKIIHIDLNAYEVAKNFPVDLGFISDPKVTLSKISSVLESIMIADQKARAKARLAHYTSLQEQKATQQQQEEQSLEHVEPLTAAQFMKALAHQLSAEAIIFDEALTATPDLVRYIPPTTPGHYFLTRGGSLGVGIPGALGIKLARPDKTVIAFTGDGGSMYTMQALWTAAHYKIGAKFVICNNHSYKLLKQNLTQYWHERHVQEHEFPPSFDLRDPDIRFDTLALSMGVQAVRLERPEQLDPVIRQMLTNDEPFLIDLVIEN